MWPYVFTLSDTTDLRIFENVCDFQVLRRIATDCWHYWTESMCSQATATMAEERSPSAISHTRRNHGWCRSCTKTADCCAFNCDDLSNKMHWRCRQPSGHVVFRNDPTSISSWIFLDDESHRRFVWKGIPPSAAGLETGSVSFLQMHVEALIRLGLNVKTLRRGSQATWSWWRWWCW